MKSVNAYLGMTARNIKVYLKDKGAILMSMMAQIIILGLYLLFLKNNYVESISSSFGELKDILSVKEIDGIVSSWLFSGVIGSSVVTVALNSLGTMVSDKQNQIQYDFGAAPVKDYIVVLSYFSGAVINTFLISAVLTTAGFLFLSLGSGIVYTLTDILAMYGLVALGSISATLILMLIVSFFRKNSTLSSFGVMVSAAIGFVIGAYIPVSQFSSGVQTGVNLVPGSQITALMRNVLMNPAIYHANELLNGIDDGIFMEQVNQMFSIKMNLFGRETGMNFMLVYSAAAIVIFLVLNLITYKISAKNKG